MDVHILIFHIPHISYSHNFVHVYDIKYAHATSSKPAITSDAIAGLISHYLHDWRDVFL